MKKTIPFVLSLYLVGNGFVALAQISLSGVILTHETKQPVAYANIGIFNQNLGTLSNPDGTFQLKLPSKYLGDTLQVSALGFEKISLLITTIVNLHEITVFIKERPIALTPVVVSDSRLKNKTFQLGNESFNGGLLETDTAYAGGSTALLIANEGPDFHDDLEFPLYVRSARIRIFKNNLDTLRFRIKLNSVDASTGAPGNDLLNTSVVVASAMRKGWLHFDLSQHNVIAAGPFFITFEQILDKKDRTAIAEGYRKFMLMHPEKLKIDTVEFEGRKEIRKMLTGSAIDLPGTFISIQSAEKHGKGRSCYTRETSFSEWKKVRGIVTATVTLSNQPR